MKLGYGVSGTDYQERIDFAKMRRQRLAKGKAAMKKHGIAAALLTRSENIRYMTAVRGVGEFAPQMRYALVFAEHEVRAQ